VAPVVPLALEEVSPLTPHSCLRPVSSELATKMRDPQMTSHALSRSRTKVETPIAAAWLRQTRVNV